MKKVFILIMALVLFCGNVFAAIVPTHITSGTVVFTGNKALVITLNSASFHINIINQSLTKKLYIDFTCRDDDGKRGYETSDTSGLVMLEEYGSLTASTIDVDLSIRNIGFLGSGLGDARYWITGESQLDVD